VPLDLPLNVGQSFYPVQLLPGACNLKG